MRSAGRGRAAAVAAGLALLLAACGSTGKGHSGVGAGGPATPAASASASTSDAPPAGTQPAALPLGAGERRVELALPGGHYQPAARGGGSDDYHCFLLDPKLTSSAFITGVYFQPGNRKIVHHAILYRVTPAQVVDAQAKDAASGGRGWTCFGDPGLPAGDGDDPVAALNSAPWLAGWAPGTGEQLLGRGLGVPLAAGSRIVLQVHYNLRAGHGVDTSTVALRLAPGTAALRPVHTTLLVAPVELPCAATESGPLCNRGNAILDLVNRFGEGAGATVAGLQLLCGGTSLTAPRAGTTQSCDRRVTAEAHIVAVAGHMHLLGRSITITLDPGTPRERVLFTRAVWNFDDQRAEPMATPVAIGPGDVLRVSCTHDAGLRSQLPELHGLTPRYVTWGAGTTDEMCLGILLETDG